MDSYNPIGCDRHRHSLDKRMEQTMLDREGMWTIKGFILGLLQFKCVESLAAQCLNFQLEEDLLEIFPSKQGGGLRMRSCLQLTTNREEQRPSLSEEEEKSMIEGVRPTEDELDCGSSALHLFPLQTHRRRAVKGKGCRGSSQCCSEWNNQFQTFNLR